ncbi:hypothetical protein I4U23_010693 [Adineta vaga]|nr:hypothetical protein I4U23_010693 [Adineta vaga]
MTDDVNLDEPLTQYSQNSINHRDDRVYFGRYSRRTNIIIIIIISIFFILLIGLLTIIAIKISTKKQSSQSLSTIAPIASILIDKSKNLSSFNIASLAHELSDELKTGDAKWMGILDIVANQYQKLSKWNDFNQITLHNNDTCTVQVKGELTELSWLWDGRIFCRNSTSESSGYSSRAGAAHHTLLDYLNKFGLTNLVTYEEIETFKNSKKKHDFK